MPVIINASTSAGAQIIPDNSGVLQFQSNGANTTSIAANGTLTSSNLTTTGRVTAGNITLSASGLITFADATTQSTAAVSGGLTLLGTISTTSGASATLGNLTLTDYKQIMLVWQGVSHNDTATGRNFLVGTSTADDVILVGTFTHSDAVRGICLIDLNDGTGAYFGNCSNFPTNGNGADTALSTASTVISVAPSLGSFDAGSIRVYGVK